MRVLQVCLSVLLFGPLSMVAHASEMAIPVSVKELPKLRQGALVQTRGYIRIKQQGVYQLESIETGQKIELDFSKSSVSPEANGLDQAGTQVMAIEAVGRVEHDKGTDTLAVIGYFLLTPSL